MTRVPSAFQDAFAGALTGQGINMCVHVCVCVCVHLKWRNDVEYQWSEFKSSPHFPCCRVLPTQTPMLGAQPQKFSLSLSLHIYMKRCNKKINKKNQEMCVSLVLSPVCNTSSKADCGVASYLKIYILTEFLLSVEGSKLVAVTNDNLQKKLDHNYCLHHHWEYLGKIIMTKTC